MKKDAKHCRRMQKGLAKYGAKIIPAKDSDDCIEDADLIITVTPSAKPVI